MTKGLSGSTLKIIAILTMLIDHIGAVVLARVIYDTGNMDVYHVYMVFRKIGRVAFPLFCFLLVEGFMHTSDFRQYATRLGCFALISEIPFDVAFQSKVWGFDYQNVFFTLFLGLLAMAVYRWLEQKLYQNRELCMIAQFAAAGGCMALAEFLRTDYGAMGVLCIMLLYVFREKRYLQVIAGSLLFLDNWTAIFGFLLMLLYNGRRGIKLKYVFYFFYPVHLLLLFAVCHFMGIAGYAAIG